MDKGSFIYGSIIMVLMNFIIRIIGFTYEVFLSRLLGAEAMGLFQIAMSTLMTFLIITTSGIPTTVTKLIAEHNSRKDKTAIETIYKFTILFNFIISLILCIALFLSAEFISINIFKNRGMVIGIYFLAPAILIISMSHIIKAYFYGMKNIITPGIGEIIEHATRFIIVATMLYYIKPTSPVIGAIIAILGISIGELFNIMWTLYSKNRLYNKKSIKMKGISILAKVLTYSLPLTISSFFSIILRFSNIILIPNRLMVTGYTSNEAIAILGRITGMAMPLLSLPFIVTSALVVNIIPNLAEKKALNRYKEIENDIILSIKSTFLISIPLTVLYITLAKPLSVFFYSDPLVANIICIMGFGTILISLQHIYSGILFGLNKQMNVMINNLIGMILRVFLIYILVADPDLGINGFYIAFYLSDIIITLLNIFTLKKVIKIKTNYVDIIGKPILASSFMISFLYFSNYNLYNLQNSNSLTFAFNLIVATFAYVFILILTKAIPKNFFSKLIKSQ